MVNGGELTQMRAGDYVREAELQKLLERYPGVLAGGHVDAASHKGPLVIRREARLGKTP